MKFICNLDNCGHIFNDTRGLKLHFKKKHGFTGDFQPYLQRIDISPDGNIEEKQEIKQENPINNEELNEIVPNPLTYPPIYLNLFTCATISPISICANPPISVIIIVVYLTLLSISHS